MMEALALLLTFNGLFVAAWPLLMMFVWTLGGLSFWLLHEAGKPGPDALPDIPDSPRVSICIPCYNEQDNAAETIAACAAQVYPNFEMIAINDGSRDGTAAVLDRLMLQYPQLRVIHLVRNQGKAVALQTAAIMASGEILVCIDGDAMLHPHCVAWLVRNFAHAPRLGAVTGNPRIRNRASLLGRLQSGEFSATVGLIKRTQRVCGRVFTVSGVIVALRRVALHDVGYWTTDNLTEDVDLTWKLSRARWTVHFEPNALAYILMPESIRGLWMQRLRWAEGGAQTFLWYTRDFLHWRGRRMWEVVCEYAITLAWCYCFMLVLVQSLLSLFGLLPAALATSPALLSLWGMVLSIACLFQFAVSTWIDRRYEPLSVGSRSQLFWMIWYPAFFWLLTTATAVVGFPRALRRGRGARARWVSPDRGFR
jgi:biofilm PGA synthesis N-glycosyltransferase PgaC